MIIQSERPVDNEKAIEIAQQDEYDILTAELIAMRSGEQQDAAIPIATPTREAYLKEYLRLKKEPGIQK